MGAPKTGNVRNVVLVGQGGVGKTSLAEAMLHLSGKTARLGGHDGTKPTLDYDPEEVKRAFSISTTIAPIDWKGARINVLDAPCYPDFIGDAFAAMSVCETALFVVDAEAGPQPTTVKLWYAAEDLRLARAVFVNRLSRSEASFATTMDLLQERFGTRLGAVTLPWGEGEDFDGIIDLVRMKARHCNGTEAVESEIPEEYRAQAEEAHDHLCELVAEADDELMMKYLEGEETLTQEELEGLLSKAIAERIFVPVFAGDCIKEQGVNSLMDDIATYFPAPTDYGEMPLIDGDSLKISSDDDRPVAFVFKTLADPQQGRISFIKVLTGTLEPGLELINARTRKSDRLAHLYVMCGRDMTEVGHAYAGDIIVAPKLAAETGDTLSITGKVEAAAFKFPNSQYRIAIEAENRGDEEKLYTFIEKACKADPTMSIDRDEETGQTIIAGMGELHLEIIVDRLLREFKVEANVGAPQVAYRETIRKEANQETKYARQSGGKGQYGHVKIKIEPNEPGKGYEFVNAIVGGAIPKEYIPAIDNGIQGAMKSGVLAGYPVVDVKVTLWDGSYHEVDSSEMAFSIAGSMAFKDAMRKADPIITEPIMKVAVIVPDEYLGDVIGDLNARRGQIQGMEAMAGTQRVNAFVPLAQMFGYATDLRSKTQGRGQYVMEPSHYEPVPKNIADQIIAGRTKG